MKTHASPIIRLPVRFGLGILACFLFSGPIEHALAIPDRQPPNEKLRTRTYRFTARIQANGGVIPFKVGEILHGAFTFDLDCRSRNPARPRHLLDSPHNFLTINLGKQTFLGAGRTFVTVADFDHAEHFGVVAPDLHLPKGWKIDHTVGSQTFGVLFQNAPKKGVIARSGIPEKLVLRDFVSTRELRLTFLNGIQFPGGQVNGMAVVSARIETLEQVRDKPRG